MSQLCIGYDETKQVYKICKYRNENGKSKWDVIEEIDPKRINYEVNTFMCDLNGNTTPVTAEWYLELGAPGRMRRELHVDMANTSDAGILERRYIMRGVYAMQRYVNGTYSEIELIEQLRKTFDDWAEINRDFEEIISNEPESKQDSLKQVFGEQNTNYFEGMKKAITQLPESTAKRIKQMMGIPENLISQGTEN